MVRLHKLAYTYSRIVSPFSLIFLLSQFPKVIPVWIVWFVSLWWYRALRLRNIRKITQERNLYQPISTNDEKIKLIAPFKDFPPCYKSDFAQGSSFRIPFIIKASTGGWDGFVIHTLSVDIYVQVVPWKKAQESLQLCILALIGKLCSLTGCYSLCLIFSYFLYHKYCKTRKQGSIITSWKVKGPQNSYLQ